VRGCIVVGKNIFQIKRFAAVDPSIGVLNFQQRFYAGTLHFKDFFARFAYFLVQAANS
jgi:hypothetical protein